MAGLGWERVNYTSLNARQQEVYNSQKVSGRGQQHLGRYVDEYAFRLNEGACDNHTMNRIAAMLLGGQGKRLIFDDLTAD